MSLKNGRGAALFSKMFEKAQNREHDLYSVPLTIMITTALQSLKNGNIFEGTRQLAMYTMKVGMEDHIEEINDYCIENLDAAMEHAIMNAPIDW